MDFDELLRPAVKAFIHSKVHEDLNKVLLAGSPFPGISVQSLAQQIQGLKIAEKKLPFLKVPNIIFPPHLSLEQASSEATARYKANLFKGENLLDLTAGFAVDSFWMGKGFDGITLVERNRELLEIVQHNWQVLGVDKATFICGDLHCFLNENKTAYSMIYLDPARRDVRDKRKFLLEDLSPDILEIEAQLYKFSKQLGIKLSPWFDLSRLCEQLKFVAEIHIIAVKNDVKELLVVCEKGFQGLADISAVNLDTNEPEFKTNPEEIAQAVPVYASPERFLYIPNNAVLKTGAFNLVGQRFHLQKLHPNTHLYSSAIRMQDFPGRILEVEIIRADEIKKGQQYNIISKNHPLKPDQIKRKYKIKEGGERYLIFTQDQKGKTILRSV